MKLTYVPPLFPPFQAADAEWIGAEGPSWLFHRLFL